MKLNEVLKKKINEGNDYWSSILLKIKEKNIYIFGAGAFGRDIKKRLDNKGRKFEGYIDNNVEIQGKEIDGLEVYNLEAVLEKGSYFIIIASTWYKEIEKQLKNSDVKNYLIIDNLELLKIRTKENSEYFKFFYKENKEKFQKVYELLGDESSKDDFVSYLSYRMTGNFNLLNENKFPQYLHPKVKPKNQEVIIDGGAFDGDTVKLFISLNLEDIEIHSFEPAISNYKILEEFTTQLGRKGLFVNNLGLGDENIELFMKTDEVPHEGYKVENEGNEKISIITIDEYLRRNRIGKVNLIKMDIEGFELNALKGAKKSILKNKPKLQICLYHSFEDLIEIPIYINEQFSSLNYQYFVGIHCNEMNDIEFLLYCY